MSDELKTPEANTSEPLVFKTDEEKTEALNNLQNRMDNGDIVSEEEFDRTFDAAIEGDPEPEGETEEPAAEEPTGVEPEKPSKPEDNKPSDGPINHFDELLSSMQQFKKEDLPTETYRDPETGIVKPFITFRNMSDFAKSYINAQKNLHYTKTELLPQQYKSGYEAAKVQYEEELNKLKAKLEEKPEPKEPAKDVQYKVPDGVDLKETMDVLQKMNPESDDYDPIEENKHLKNAFGVVLNQLNKVNETIEKQGSEFASFKTQQEETFAQQQARLEAERQQELVKQAYQNTCAEIDSFASSEVGKSLNLTGQETFDQMVGGAESFEKQMASLYFNKPIAQVTGDDRMTVASAYLSKNPNLVTKMQQVGMEEPGWYERYTFLDNIERAKEGFVRNPITQQFEQKYASDGSKVRFPDMNAAFNYIKDTTGIREQEIAEAKKAAGAQALEAATKRDDGLVSMDTSGQHVNDNPTGLTEQQAVEVLNTIQPEDAISQAAIGNMELLNRLNAAFVTLGNEPLEAPTAVMA